MLRLTLVLFLLPFSAFGASPAELARLHEALATSELMEILSEEGIAQSEELRDEMFPGRGGVGWASTIGSLYASDRLESLFRTAFDEELADKDLEQIIDFYQSDTGRLVASVEIEARRAIMSEEVEDASKVAYERVAEDEPDRLSLLQEFAELNELIDRNVAGALNANLAFYRGLGSGGTFEMTESQMLNEVWQQEASIREDTTSWVFGYMTLAYDTLSDDQLRAYVDMTATDAGRDLNRALFAGFDAVFLDVSYQLGAATARFSVGDEL